VSSISYETSLVEEIQREVYNAREDKSCQVDLLPMDPVHRTLDQSMLQEHDKKLGGTFCLSNDQCPEDSRTFVLEEEDLQDSEDNYDEDKYGPATFVTDGPSSVLLQSHDSSSNNGGTVTLSVNRSPSLVSCNQEYNSSPVRTMEQQLNTFLSSELVDQCCQTSQSFVNNCKSSNYNTSRKYSRIPRLIPEPTQYTLDNENSNKSTGVLVLPVNTEISQISPPPARKVGMVYPNLQQVANQSTHFFNQSHQSVNHTTNHYVSQSANHTFNQSSSQRNVTVVPVNNCSSVTVNREAPSRISPQVSQSFNKFDKKSAPTSNLRRASSKKEIVKPIRTSASDARLVKRMVTGNMRSSVSCLPSAAEATSGSDASAAGSPVFFKEEARQRSPALQRSQSVSCVSTLPKWRGAGTGSNVNAASNTQGLSGQGVCKRADAAVIPKPKDVRITKRVGSDGVVLAWSPPESDCVSGFCVVVGGQVLQKHTNAKNRTKTVLTGLPMTSPCNIGLMYIGADGRTSKPAVVTCERSAYCVPQSAAVRRRCAPVAVAVRRPL